MRRGHVRRGLVRCTALWSLSTHHAMCGGKGGPASASRGTSISTTERPIARGCGSSRRVSGRIHARVVDPYRPPFISVAAMPPSASSALASLGSPREIASPASHATMTSASSEPCRSLLGALNVMHDAGAKKVASCAIARSYPMVPRCSPTSYWLSTRTIC